MHILHVLDHSLPIHSGYTFRTRAILNGQHALGWQTTHLTSPKHYGAEDDVETFDGLTFHRTRPATGRWARWPLLDHWSVARATRERLVPLAREIRPDLIHAHSPALNGIAAVQAGRRLGIPVVYEVRAFWEDAAVDHGTTREGSLRYRLTRALETWVLRRADQVTTICEGLRADIVARGIAPEKVTVIPNAVDPSAFTPGGSRDEALARALGIHDRTVLGFLGSFYAYEGLDLLIRALPALRGRHPEVCVLLVGGGPQEARLKTLVRKLDLAGSVAFAGRIPHEEVHRYYALVDVFVYPRLSMRLTELVTPLKPLEAMAQGGIVLASDVGGHRELIEDGVTGALFAAGDATALAEAAARLITERDRWPERALAARAFVERERTWETSVARYREVYARALGHDP